MLMKKKPTTEISVRHVIAEGGVVTGDLEVSGGVQIDGVVRGRVTALTDQGAVLVGPTGRIEGPVDAATVVVAGTLKGTVRARHMTVKSTGCVEGDCVVQSLHTETGAILCGKMDSRSEVASSEVTVLRSESASNAGEARARLEQDRQRKGEAA